MAESNLFMQISKELSAFRGMCASLCASHPLFPALQCSAEVLEAVHLPKQLEAPFPQLGNLLLFLLSTPRFLLQASHQPTQVG